MTLLMFSQTPHGVAIFTDTLTTDTTQGNVPAKYRSKVWTFPHLNMAMVVTGFADIGDAWADRMNRRSGIRDIEGMNEVAPDDLRFLFKSLDDHYKGAYPNESIGTATVYMFGFPHGTNDMVRYTYRSISDFESERTQETEPRFVAKPPPHNFDLYAPESIDEALTLAVRLREENGDGTEAGMVAIGGEIYLTTLDRPGMIISDLAYRFPDYEETWQKICEWAARI